MADKHLITAQRLRELLNYDPETGIFTRLKSGPGRYNQKGARAGCVDSHGYIQIMIDGITYLAHRLAFFYMIGEWPKNQIDHKNGRRDANNWENIREATSQQNCANAKLRTDNASGFKGVREKGGRFQARIRVNKKLIHLGYRATPEEAHALYQDAARYHFGMFNNPGC